MIAALVLVSLVPPFFARLPSVWLTAVIPAMAILSIMGWIDDRRTLSPVLRLLVQFAVSFWLLAFLSQSLSTGVNGAPVVLAFLLAAVLLVWMMNAYNFMDGSDGMAGGEGLFAAGVTGFLFLQAGEYSLAGAAFMLAAVCLGFLPWNFPRARVFMGDAGSVPLGFCLAALILPGVVVGGVSLPIAGLVLSVFLVDSTLTLLLRFLNGEQWYTPHKRHVYQRLIERGWSHGRVLALYQGMNLAIVLPGILMCIRYPGHSWLIASLAWLVLIFGWCVASLKSGWKLERQVDG